MGHVLDVATKGAEPEFFADDVGDVPVRPIHDGALARGVLGISAEPTERMCTENAGEATRE